MSRNAPQGDTLPHLDDRTRRLLRIAAITAAGEEQVVRAELQEHLDRIPHQWVEELLLQTHLFAGFPRALNAMREWRRIAGPPVPAAGVKRPSARIRADGERTCALVYGSMYERLRENIRALHPLLDEWMILDGYGKVLSRDGLDLARRELCIVAACAATAQDRQLQSHLHGALNVGVPAAVITAALGSLREVIAEAILARALRLWSRIRPEGG